ncbi:MAG: geranylgeranyl reductase family protein [Acidimicrobiales bacterium]|nr:geranylgeranyl reductase family protein [Acidimicrobiales bacterium]
MDEQVDLVVVGAGPAGAAAAIVAARAGLDVALVDKASFPRDKCCGDGLTAAALRELEQLGLEPDAVPSWQPVRDIVLHAPSLRRVELRLPEGAGQWSVVARRRELDAALVELAVRTGARLHTGEAVRSVETVEGPEGDTRLAVRTDTLRLRTTALVAADGMWSPVRKLVGALHPPGYRGEWHAFRQYFSGAGPDARRRQHIWFPADLLPAYVWSFPLADGTVNVGFGLLRGGGPAVGDGATLWRALLQRPEISGVLGDALVAEAPMRAWPIPARIDGVSLSACGGRVLFVGDAATAPDPMTGEGIGQALQTGRLAAEAIVHRHHGVPTDRSAGSSADAQAVAVAAAYQAAVRRHLWADHRLARGLSRILAHRRGAELSLRAVDANGWTRRNFARWMFEDYPRAVVGTPQRWHRGQFRGEGAFGTRAPST